MLQLVSDSDDNSAYNENTSGGYYYIGGCAGHLGQDHLKAKDIVGHYIDKAGRVSRKIGSYIEVLFRR